LTKLFKRVPLFIAPRLLFYDNAQANRNHGDSQRGLNGRQRGRRGLNTVDHPSGRLRYISRVDAPLAEQRVIPRPVRKWKTGEYG
jgi:hypothetical protein